MFDVPTICARAEMNRQSVKDSKCLMCPLYKALSNTIGQFWLSGSACVHKTRAYLSAKVWGGGG